MHSSRRGRGPIPLVLLPLLALALLAGACDPAPDLPDRTPLEANGFERLTTHEELTSFVRALAPSPRVELLTLGASLEGREIPLLKFSLGEFGADRGEKVMTLIYAQQHGNEPSGKEGALALALELARGDHDDVLERVDVLLVPQVNPDGGDADERQNAEGVDLNRSHLILDGHEVTFLRELFHRWEPEVAVDVHEYYPWSGTWLDEGWLRLFDVQVGLPTNLNTDPEILALAEDGFLRYSEEVMADAGYTTHNYLVGSPELLRWSTSNINDGRQGLGILQTLSFIFEGRRGEPQDSNLERRASSQRLAQEALLRFSAERRDEILAVVGEARARARDEAAPREFVLTMTRERSEASLEIPVELAEEVEEGDWVVQDTVTASIENWYPIVAPVHTTTLPDAYLIPSGESELIELLERHRVKVTRLAGGEGLEAERLEITGFETEDLVEATVELPVVRVEEGRIEAEAGDVLVPTAQLRGRMVATALEPRSMHGLRTYGAFEHLGQEGAYPVIRVFHDR